MVEVLIFETTDWTTQKIFRDEANRVWLLGNILNCSFHKYYLESNNIYIIKEVSRQELSFTSYSGRLVCWYGRSCC